MSQGRAGGQNLGHLQKPYFFFLLLFFFYVIKEQVLFRVDFPPVTSDCRLLFFLLFYLLRNHS